MNRLILALAIISIFARCSATHHKHSDSADPKTAIAPHDMAPKVTGIGGVFFFSDNPKETKAWYAQNLGLEFNEWGGVTFESRNIQDPERINRLQWSLFKKTSDYFQPSKKEFMINYTVQDLVGLVVKLKSNGVTVLDTMETYDFGKFIHIMDKDGNKIELWEPIDNARKK